MTETLSLPHVYREGSGPLLLMLHGTGGDEQQILGLADALDPEAAVLAPRGQVTEHGAARWFRRHGEGQFDVDDVIVRAAQLADFGREAVEVYGLGGRPLVAVGFSNGANIALATALRHPDVLNDVIAFSGMYPFGDRELETRLDGVRLLLLNGSADAMAPADSVSTLERQTLAHGADVTRISRNGGHGITEPELETAREWIAAAGRVTSH